MYNAFGKKTAVFQSTLSLYKKYMPMGRKEKWWPVASPYKCTKGTPIANATIFVE